MATAHLGLALPEEELHALLDELGPRYELKRDGGTIPSTQNALRVIHGHYSHCLAHSLRSSQSVIGVNARQMQDASVEISEGTSGRRHIPRSVASPGNSAAR